MSSTKMVARDEELEVEVRREDQDKINEFGRLNFRKHELKADIQRLKEKLERLDDASTELMMAEGEPVQLYIGDCFVQTEEEYATDYLEKEQEKLQTEQSDLSAELERVLARQQELKKALYGRFGKSINLEDE